MPRRKQGKPSQPIATATGQEYGKAQQQEQSLRAMPLPATPALPAAAPTGAVATAAPPRPAGPLPGELGDLLGPTDRPSEPLTAGLPFGPGAGPEALGRVAPNPNDPLSMLRVLYQVFPYEEIRQQLEAADESTFDRSQSMPPVREA